MHLGLKELIDLILNSRRCKHRFFAFMLLNDIDHMGGDGHYVSADSTVHPMVVNQYPGEIIRKQIPDN